jgi:hypothetical protein
MSHAYIPVTLAQVQRIAPHLPPHEVSLVHEVLVSLGNQISLMPLTHGEIQSCLDLLSRVHSGN